MAVTAGTRLALTTRQTQIFGVRIGESRTAVARIRPRRVQALGVVTAVVQIIRFAFIQI